MNDNIAHQIGQALMDSHPTLSRIADWFLWSDEIKDYINQHNQMDVWIDMIDSDIWVYKKMKK